MSLPAGFIPTKSSLLKVAPSEFENVTFQSHKSKMKSSKPKKLYKEAKGNETNKSVDLRKIRYEIIKLGTSGMGPTKKEASSIALAVALGAKPPKRKYTNYKEMLNVKILEREKLGSSAPCVDTSIQPKHGSQRHLYVVGNKVIPAKPKSKDGVKNFLDSYGKPGRAKIGKGFKKTRTD